MPLRRDAVRSLAVAVVFLVAPVGSLTVQVCQIREDPPWQEVLFYEPDKPFYGSFGVRVAWLAQRGLELECVHELFVILLPDGRSIGSPANYDTFHVICHNPFRDGHGAKAMKHPDEQILLLGIREEFYKDFATVMADHGKAGNLLNLSTLHLGFHKAPVHLVRFAGFCFVTETSGALGNGDTSFGRNKVVMLLDIRFHLGQASGISCFIQPIEAYLGVCDSFLQEGIKHSSKTSENGAVGMLTDSAMRSHHKVILLQSAKPGP